MLVVSPAGVERSSRIEKLGMWSSDTAQVYLDNVRVPQEYVIGEEGQGFTYQMIQFQAERMWGTAAGRERLHCLVDL